MTRKVGGNGRGNGGGVYADSNVSRDDGNSIGISRSADCGNSSNNNNDRTVAVNDTVACQRQR